MSFLNVTKVVTESIGTFNKIIPIFILTNRLVRIIIIEYQLYLRRAKNVAGKVYE